MAPLPERRFPPPWSVEDIGGYFVLRDRHGQALAYVYYGEEPEGRGAAGYCKLFEPNQCEVVTNNRKLTLSLLRWNHDSG